VLRVSSEVKRVRPHFYSDIVTHLCIILTCSSYITFFCVYMYICWTFVPRNKKNISVYRHENENKLQNTVLWYQCMF